MILYLEYKLLWNIECLCIDFILQPLWNEKMVFNHQKSSNFQWFKRELKYNLTLRFRGFSPNLIWGLFINYGEVKCQNKHLTCAHKGDAVESVGEERTGNYHGGFVVYIQYKKWGHSLHQTCHLIVTNFERPSTFFAVRGGILRRQSEWGWV